MYGHTEFLSHTAAFALGKAMEAQREREVERERERSREREVERERERGREREVKREREVERERERGCHIDTQTHTHTHTHSLSLSLSLSRFSAGFFVFETRDTLNMYLAHNAKGETLIVHHMLGVILYFLTLSTRSYLYLSCVVLIEV